MASAGSKRAAESGGGGGGKRKYHQPAAPGVTELARGMRGVLFTCETHIEKRAIREAFTLLETLVGEAAPASAPGAVPATTAGAGGDAGGSGGGDGGGNTAADALAAEIAELRGGSGGKGAAGGGKGAPTQRKRFSVAQTGCGGTIMVRFGDASDDPMALASRAMDQAASSALSGAPHIIRFYPVTAVCGATATSIAAALEPLLEPLRGCDSTRGRV